MELTTKQAEPVEFELFAYASKKERAPGKGFKTLPTMLPTDEPSKPTGLKQRQYVSLPDVPVRMSTIIEMVAPETVGLGRFGGGWSGLLRGIPPDSAFAIKLRKVLELQVQHTVVWDADIQEAKLMLVKDALALQVPVTGKRAAGIRV